MLSLVVADSQMEGLNVIIQCLQVQLVGPVHASLSDLSESGCRWSGDALKLKGRMFYTPAVGFDLHLSAFIRKTCQPPTWFSIATDCWYFTHTVKHEGMFLSI